MTKQKLFETIYLSEGLSDKGQEQSMEDFEAFLASDELDSFLAETHAEIVSSSRQMSKGTVQFEFPNGRLVQITKEGYIRSPNNSGASNHLLNKAVSRPTGGKYSTEYWDQELLTYQEALSRLAAAVKRNPKRYTDEFEYSPNFRWEQDNADKLNARRAARANRS